MTEKEISESSCDSNDTNTTLKSKILKQVEFYFNDANLPRDKFLLEKIRSNPDGWVSLELISSFNRMKSLTNDQQLVQESLKDSKDLLELNDDGSMVRRKAPMDTNRDTINSSLYMKGFPTDATLDEIENTLSAYSKAILSICMRRIKEEPRPFKGSIFVDLANIQESLELSKKSIIFKRDSNQVFPITVMTKKDYLETKSKERKLKTLSSLFVPGCLIRATINNVDSFDTREFKAAFEQATESTIAFIETPTKNENISFILRLHQPKAPEIIEKLNKIETDSGIVDLNLVTGNEEEKYYMDYLQNKKNNMKRKGQFGKRNNKNRKNTDH